MSFYFVAEPSKFVHTVTHSLQAKRESKVALDFVVIVGFAGLSRCWYVDNFALCNTYSKHEIFSVRHTNDKIPIFVISIKFILSRLFRICSPNRITSIIEMCTPSNMVNAKWKDRPRWAINSHTQTTECKKKQMF